MKIRLNFWQIAFGRVLSGAVCGVLNTLLGIFINENVPSENSSQYGLAINSGMCLGGLLCNILGIILVPNM